MRKKTVIITGIVALLVALLLILLSFKYTQLQIIRYANWLPLYTVKDGTAFSCYDQVLNNQLSYYVDDLDMFSVNYILVRADTSGDCYFLCIYDIDTLIKPGVETDRVTENVDTSNIIKSGECIAE